jgi:hypothetical protein
MANKTPRNESTLLLKSFGPPGDKYLYARKNPRRQAAAGAARSLPQPLSSAAIFNTVPEDDKGHTFCAEAGVIFRRLQEPPKKRRPGNVSGMLLMSAGRKYG